MSAPTRPTSVDDVRTRIGAELEGVVDDLRRTASAVSPDGAPLVAALGSLLQGGKKLRAALCYWSWRAHAATGQDASDEQDAAVLRVGATLELFQAAALLHDDIIDASSTRRGRPTAHVAFEQGHRDAGWWGPSDRFGTSAALLAGDLALVEADATFAGALDAFGAEVRERARAVYDEMQRVVTVGQYLDLHAQAVSTGADPEEDERRALEVVRAKAARYSVEQPLLLGAALAGADDAAFARASAYGLPLGEAFQLRDDLLGVLGDPATTGKPSGDDLREGKRTVLVARALALGSDDERAALGAALGHEDASAHAVARAQDALVSSGAVASVEVTIAGLAKDALSALDAAPLVEPGRTQLREIAHLLVDRDV